MNYGRRTMIVTRVHTDHGSHIEPPLNPEWSLLRKLEWAAAVGTADSGLEITVSHSRYWVDRVLQRDVFNLGIDGAVSGPHTYQQAWAWIHGVTAGAQAVRKAYAAELHEAAEAAGPNRHFSR